MEMKHNNLFILNSFNLLVTVTGGFPPPTLGFHLFNWICVCINILWNSLLGGEKSSDWRYSVSAYRMLLNWFSELWEPLVSVCLSILPSFCHSACEEALQSYWSWRIHSDSTNRVSMAHMNIARRPCDGSMRDILIETSYTSSKTSFQKAATMHGPRCPNVTGGHSYFSPFLRH